MIFTYYFSRKKHKDSMEGMCEEVNDSGRRERRMQRLTLRCL